MSRRQCIFVHMVEKCFVLDVPQEERNNCTTKLVSLRLCLRIRPSPHLRPLLLQPLTPQRFRQCISQRPPPLAQLLPPCFRQIPIQPTELVHCPQSTRRYSRTDKLAHCFRPELLVLNVRCPCSRGLLAGLWHVVTMHTPWCRGRRNFWGRRRNQAREPEPWCRR